MLPKNNFTEGRAIPDIEPASRLNNLKIDLRSVLLTILFESHSQITYDNIYDTFLEIQGVPRNMTVSE